MHIVCLQQAKIGTQPPVELWYIYNWTQAIDTPPMPKDYTFYIYIKTFPFYEIKFDSFWNVQLIIFHEILAVNCKTTHG